MSSHSIHPTTTLDLKSELPERVVVHGPNCTIRIGEGVQISAPILIFAGASNALIEIGDGCVIAGGFRVVRGDGGVIRIGPGTSFNDVGISMHEASEVTFGADCMLSTNIHMDPSDMHPLFDRATGQRLNPPAPIHIGDHVWIGTRVLILKGARIGSGAVIGAGSMVAGTIPEKALAVGSPAKVVRHNVGWLREVDQTFPAEGPPPRAPRRWPWSRRDR